MMRVRINQLYIDFDSVPVAAIKTMFKQQNFFYAPIYLALKDGGAWEELAKKRLPRKLKPGEVDEGITEPELKEEMQWLKDRLRLLISLLKFLAAVLTSCFDVQ